MNDFWDVAVEAERSGVWGWWDGPFEGVDFVGFVGW